MPEPERDLAFNHLAGVFNTAFKWTLEAYRKDDSVDLTERFCGLVASALRDARLTVPPQRDITDPLMPFLEAHRIVAKDFMVGRSGAGGGPALDMLLQVRFDTEDAEWGFGVPLFLRAMPGFGAMPRFIWQDLRESCAWVNRLTPCARIVLFAEDEDFDFGPRRILQRHPVIAIGAHEFSGLRAPPRAPAGRLLEHFSNDLACGWIGDPAPSGLQASQLLDALLRDMHVRHVLQLRVERVLPGR